MHWIVWLVLPLVVGLWLLLRPVRYTRARRIPTTPEDSDLAVDWEKATQGCPKTGEAYVVIGAGFLGCRIINALLLRGETGIRAADKSRAVFDKHFKGDARVEFFEADMTKPEDMVKACEGRTVVFHTAAVIRYSDRLPHQWPLSYNINVKGIENVIAACLHQNVRKLIYTSSSNVNVGYGLCSLTMTEDTPYVTEKNTPNHYGLSKAMAEQRVLAANGKQTRGGQELLTCAIRPTSGIFGCGDGFLTDTWLVKDKPVDQMFPNMFIDYVYVDNVVVGQLLAETKLPGAAAGQPFAIHNEEPITGYNLFLGLRHYYKGPVGPERFAPFYLTYLIAWILEVLRMAFPKKKWDFGQMNMLSPALFQYCACDYVYRTDKARNLLGYRPVFSVDQALQRTVREATTGRHILQSTRQPNFPRPPVASGNHS
eukprot:TRINITY_DN27971_c0_g1_i1.p1 TRINITY_DN27971_c0_g1~~TRINITY_DN27971_c0_g1_i1.p1  ORF type:complete len:426 (-),score=81.07 TRINITY_DN27971_c0_g1_i1:58-1335(-)